MNGPTDGGRAQAFQALRDSEELHRVVLTNMSDAVFLTDDTGRFTFVCPNVDIIFGYAPDEVQAMSRIGLLLGENLVDTARLAAEGEIRNIERDITAKSGRRRTVLVHVKKVSIQGSTVLYACRDVTERKMAEDGLRAAHEELAHSSRLALVGELVASIVHEVKQPLTSISANASAAIRLLGNKASLSDATMFRDILTDVQSECLHARDVVERLRTVARKQTIELEVLDVSEVLNDLLGLLGGEARMRGITLDSKLGPCALKVNGDRVCLRQAVLNLVMNAMDAVSQTDREPRVIIGMRQVGDVVEISVTDTGPGVPAQDVPRLFEAFFTTKKEGVGLGLTIARTLVEAQGGRIALADGRAGGTTFQVILPTYPGT
jgi:PAS domain S-box-containing protein